MATAGAQAMSVKVRSSTTGSASPATAATATGTAKHAIQTRPRPGSRRWSSTAPAAIARTTRVVRPGS